MRYNAKLPVSNGNNGPARSYTRTQVLYNKIYFVHNIGTRTYAKKLHVTYT